MQCHLKEIAARASKSNKLECGQALTARARPHAMHGLCNVSWCVSKVNEVDMNEILTYLWNALDFHLPMRRICESDIPCPVAYEAAPMRKLCPLLRTGSRPHSLIAADNCLAKISRATGMPPCVMKIASPWLPRRVEEQLNSTKRTLTINC